MHSKRLSASVTMFALGSLSTPAMAAEFYATDDGTPIDLIGDSTPEYRFYSDLDSTSGYTLIAQSFFKEYVGPNSPTPYFPGVSQPGLGVFQENLTDGYYGLLFTDGLESDFYTGYAVVDMGGSHISNMVFKPLAAVPEPESWALMLLGFGAVGAGLRQRRRQDALAA